MNYKIRNVDGIIAAFEDEIDRELCLKFLEDYWGVKLYPVNDDE